MIFRILRSRSVEIVALAALVGLGVLAGGVSSSPGPGCDEVQADGLAESPLFTPIGRRYGLAPDPPLNPLGLEFVSPVSLAVAPTAMDGRAVRWIVGSAGGGQYIYYLDRPIDKTMTPSTFAAAGGIEFDVEAVTDAESFATYLLAEVGDRAIPVLVGPHRGALTWADPNVAGVRTHNVYWSDGTYEFALIAVREAHEALNLARALVCSTPG